MSVKNIESFKREVITVGVKTTIQILIGKDQAPHLEDKLEILE